MSIAEGVIIKIAANILLNDEQTGINVFWAEVADNIGAGPLDDDDVLDAAANWLDVLYTNLLAVLADTIIGTIAEVWTVNLPDGDLTPVGFGVQTWEGTSAADALPNGNAMICAISTEDTDVYGRKFIPGVNEGSTVDNNISAGSLVALLGFAEDWVAQYIDANDVVLNPGVYSNAQNAFRASVDSFSANAIIGYQRRRKPGVGT